GVRRGQPGLHVGAAERDRPGVAGRGVVVDVPGRDRDTGRRPRGGGRVGRHGEMGRRGRGDRHLRGGGGQERGGGHHRLRAGGGQGEADGEGVRPRVGGGERVRQRLRTHQRAAADGDRAGEPGRRVAV